jgi:hypothetical protein
MSSEHTTHPLDRSAAMTAGITNRMVFNIHPARVAPNDGLPTLRAWPERLQKQEPMLYVELIRALKRSGVTMDALTEFAASADATVYGRGNNRTTLAELSEHLSRKYGPQKDAFEDAGHQRATAMVQILEKYFFEPATRDPLIRSKPAVEKINVEVGISTKEWNLFWAGGVQARGTVGIGFNRTHHQFEAPLEMFSARLQAQHRDQAWYGRDGRLYLTLVTPLRTEGRITEIGMMNGAYAPSSSLRRHLLPPAS